MFNKKPVQTIDSIVADITEKVTALRNITFEKSDEIEGYEDQIENLAVLRTEATQELNRASKLADNFAKLVAV